MKRVLLALALMIYGSAALAEQPIKGNYYGFTYLEMETTTTGNSYAPAGFLVRYGMPMNEDWSFELQTGAGNPAGTVSIHRVNSLFMRYGTNYEQMYVYTMIGLSRVTASVSGTEYTDDRGSYGLGMLLKIGNTNLSIEWMNYGSSSAYSLNSLNFGILKAI